MTRVRYFVDRPKGPRGGNRDTGPFYNLKSAQTDAKARDEYRIGNRIIKPARVAGQIRVVDLDVAPFNGVDSDEEFTWHESRMQYHASEAQRLKPGVELRTAEQFLTSADLMTLRQAIERHFAAVRNDREWKSDASRWAQLRLEELLKELLADGKLGATP